MKITKISYERLDLKLSEPYTIAYETVSEAANFILKIHTDTGLTGYGCGVPDMEVTGEDLVFVENHLENTVIPNLKGKNPLRYSRILEELSALIDKKGSVLAMVDMALLDIMAKKADIPLYQLLGGYKNSIPTSITVGIKSLEETLVEVEKHVKTGFTIVKLKGGLNLGADIEKLGKIRERHQHLTLRFDANQGYSVADAIRFVNETKKYGIQIFEQPVPTGQEESMRKVTQSVSYPVMADESLKSLTDAFRMAKNETMDMVNIKLMKVGGITEAMHINSVARAAGLEAMVGCIDECSLGIAAGLHFALSRPNIHFADLDGHLDFEKDPFSGLFSIKKGVLYPNEKAGLGV